MHCGQMTHTHGAMQDNVAILKLIHTRMCCVQKKRVFTNAVKKFPQLAAYRSDILFSLILD